MVAYLTAFLRFSAWCDTSGWAARVPDVPALEFALMDWMEELHEDGVGPHIGNCALGAIRVLSRRIHGELVDARALLSDWNGVGNAVHWPPLPYPLLFLLAEDRLQRGDVGCALAFLLAFTALLRISEVAGLRVCDVVFPEDPRFWGGRVRRARARAHQDGRRPQCRGSRELALAYTSGMGSREGAGRRDLAAFPVGAGVAGSAAQVFGRAWGCARRVRVPLAPGRRCALPAQLRHGTRRGSAAWSLAPAGERAPVPAAFAHLGCGPRAASRRPRA